MTPTQKNNLKASFFILFSFIIFIIVFLICFWVIDGIFDESWIVATIGSVLIATNLPWADEE